MKPNRMFPTGRSKADPLLQFVFVCLSVWFIRGVFCDVSLSLHYKNTPIQIHCKFYRRKHENIKMKNCDIFLIFAQNIDCKCSLEPPQRGGSNEYHNLCFQPEIRKIMYTPVNPSFTI